MLARPNQLFLLCASLAFLFAYLCSFHIHPFRSYYNDLSMVAVLPLLALALLRKGRLFLPRSQLSLVPLGLILLIVAQMLLISASHWQDLLFSVLYLGLVMPAVCLGAAMADDALLRPKAMQWLATLFLLAGVISTWMQLTQLFGMKLSPFVMYMAKGDAISRPYANIAQPNQLALVLCFSLASLWYLYERRLTDRWTALTAAVFLLCGLVLTQSRIGWIIVPAFALTMAGRARKSGQGDWKIYPVIAFAYFGLVALLPGIAELIGYSGGSVVEHVGGRSERLGLWRHALHMANTHPWFGVGWAGFGSEQVRIAADFPSTTYAEHAHNIVLNFATEMGWPVTISLCAAAVYWVYQIRKLLSDDGNLLAMLCLGAALVHSMVEFPLWYAYILLPVAWLMGMLHQQRWPAKASQIPLSGVLAGTALFIAVASWMTWDYQRVVAGFNVLRWYPDATESRRQSLQPPQHTLYPEFFAYFRLMGISPEEGMSADDIAFVEQWTPRFGFIHILNKLAEVSVLNGQPAKASRAMQTMQRLHPDSYPEYYDYWRAKAGLDPRYMAVFKTMPARDSR